MMKWTVINSDWLPIHNQALSHAEECLEQLVDNGIIDQEKIKRRHEELNIGKPQPEEPKP